MSKHAGWIIAALIYLLSAVYGAGRISARMDSFEAQITGLKQDNAAAIADVKKDIAEIRREAYHGFVAADSPAAVPPRKER